MTVKVQSAVKELRISDWPIKKRRAVICFVYKKQCDRRYFKRQKDDLDRRRKSKAPPIDPVAGSWKSGLCPEGRSAHSPALYREVSTAVYSGEKSFSIL